MENKTSKYFKYALGEIILVVIGILIALQINNWNQQRLDSKKEVAYLEEVLVSLKSDINKIDDVLKFNIEKDSIVTNLMLLFKADLTNDQRMAIIENYATPFTSYELFSPNATAWNNFVSAENINLIENEDLRKKLVAYYSFDYNGSVQERIMIMNRKVIDENFPKFFTREYTLKTLNLDTKLPTNKEFNLHLNQRFLSDLFGIRYLIKMQNDFLNHTSIEIKALKTLINQELEL